MSPCASHMGWPPVDLEKMQCCPDCGAILDTKTCEGCGGEFLDFDAKDGDDIVARPVVNDSGNLVCVHCYRRRYRIDSPEGDSG